MSWSIILLKVKLLSGSSGRWHLCSFSAGVWRTQKSVPSSLQCCAWWIHVKDFQKQNWRVVNLDCSRSASWYDATNCPVKCQLPLFSPSLHCHPTMLTDPSSSLVSHLLRDCTRALSLDLFSSTEATSWMTVSSFTNFSSFILRWYPSICLQSKMVPLPPDSLK